jgi:hypothetical protein
LVSSGRSAAEYWRFIVAMNPNFPWRSMTIEQALDVAVEPLIKRGLATANRGDFERKITAADERLARPLPGDLRTFYRRVAPVSQCPELGGGSVGFQPISDPDLTWLDDRQMRQEKLWVAPSGDCWLAGWETAQLLVIGYTEFGDWLLWCDNLPGRSVGTVVLTDHEGEVNPIVLGDSLGQWLGRYFKFGFVEYAICEGDLDEIEPAEVEAFLSDHLRLNPVCQWAKKKLAAVRRH